MHSSSIEKTVRTRTVREREDHKRTKRVKEHRSEQRKLKEKFYVLGQ
jgi:hypothetical protein